MLLYPDYKSLVIQDYKKKRANNVLHSGLIHPTPAGLRDACLSVCNDRYSTKDKRTLGEFFGQGSDKVACLKAIDQLEAARFKPLGNFLKKLAGKTENKNIELLAWLIDFQPRPFVFNELPNTVETNTGQGESLKEGLNGESETGTPPSIHEREKVSPDPPPSNPPVRKTKIGIVILSIIITASAAIGIYWSETDKYPRPGPTGYGACMFWDGDHYQPISCKKHGDTLVVPLDSNKLVHFRKIQQSDTITTNAIGAVWYVKYRKDYEFYTADGNHPIDPQLRLKPITEFIIRNHVHPKQ